MLGIIVVLAALLQGRFHLAFYVRHTHAAICYARYRANLAPWRSIICEGAHFRCYFLHWNLFARLRFVHVVQTAVSSDCYL